MDVLLRQALYLRGCTVYGTRCVSLHGCVMRRGRVDAYETLSYHDARRAGDRAYQVLALDTQIWNRISNFSNMW